MIYSFVQHVLGTFLSINHFYPIGNQDYTKSCPPKIFFKSFSHRKRKIIAVTQLIRQGRALIDSHYTFLLPHNTVFRFKFPNQYIRKAELQLIKAWSHSRASLLQNAEFLYRSSNSSKQFPSDCEHQNTLEFYKSSVDFVWSGVVM